jgi:hypothetical protein
LVCLLWSWGSLLNSFIHWWNTSTYLINYHLGLTWDVQKRLRSPNLLFGFPFLDCL